MKKSLLALSGLALAATAALGGCASHDKEEAPETEVDVIEQVDEQSGQSGEEALDEEQSGDGQSGDVIILEEVEETDTDSDK